MIGVIADDLSGAAEIGAIGLRYGLRGEIVLTPVASSVAADVRRRIRAKHRSVRLRTSAVTTLLCVDTDSRTCPPDEAARRAADAATMLQKAGVKWIYKKVDSVLRGNVLAEVEAIAAVLGKPGSSKILLHPANPSLGRIIRDGQYFVRGKPIHRTEFARDPGHPRRTADVRALLTGNGTDGVCVGTLRSPLPEDRIIICESASPRDVKRWAERADDTALLAGGAEFFAAVLAARLGGQPDSSGFRASAEIPAVSGRELFVCGSTSESCRDFISASRKNGTPMFSLPREMAWGADFTRTAAKVISAQVAKAFESEPRVVLRIGLRTVREGAVARKLSGHLTQLAEAVLKRVQVSRVYAEGGATAVELARRMGWTRLEVIREVAPGVATLAVNGDSPVQVTIKPGTYVWPDEIQALPAVAK